MQFIALAFVVLFFSACDKKEKIEPEVPNEEEVITTLSVNLVNSTDASNKVKLSFRDLDGDGGKKPVITGGTLKANSLYTASLELLNESETPVDVVTKEILEENDEHQFFFSVAEGLNLSTQYADKDANGNPVGLQIKVKTGAASKGKYNIILRHQPNKKASGVSVGNIQNAGGETDIEVSFPVTIQ